MSYLVVWDERAVLAAARFLDDPEGLRGVLNAIDALAEDPRPLAAAELGSPDLRRIRLGRYRVVYEISSPGNTVAVVHIGRIG